MQEKMSMTVGELIERLRRFPLDYEVLLWPYIDDGWSGIYYITKSFGDKVAISTEPWMMVKYDEENVYDGKTKKASEQASAKVQMGDR